MTARVLSLDRRSAKPAIRHIIEAPPGLVDGFDGGRPFPRVLGTEAAGTVLALGEDSAGLEVGDAVFGLAAVENGHTVGKAVIKVA